MAYANCVFVVDNDPSARKGIARLLRTANYDVGDFDSIEEFINALDSEVPSCVVLDADMPDLHCEELREELKARGIQPPIIAITANDDPETRRKAQIMNAAGFFRKPVDGTALLDAVEWSIRSNSEVTNPKER